MSAEREDPKQIAAFRALAHRISDEQSQQRFEEALRRLMSPTPDDDRGDQPLKQVKVQRRTKSVPAEF
jgi:hypothetical protein